MRSFPTGVAVVTSVHAGQPAGMTINSLLSVSLEPLLVLVSLAEGTRTLQAIAKSHRFAASVLASDHEHVARAFAANGAPFPRHLVEPDEAGALVVPGALARLRCSVRRIIAAGDHRLVLAEVDDLEVGAGRPLVFYRGGFHRLAGEAEERA